MASWDVFRELDTLRRDIDEAFRGYGVGRSVATPFLSPSALRRFPPVNLSEDEEQLYLQVLVPGVEPKGINLTIMRNVVTIAGERKPTPEQEGEMIHRNEIWSGTFSRSVELPMDVDSARISADCRDGVLCIRLEKAEHAKPKKIAIKPS
jgi:HSP20 family protein